MTEGERIDRLPMISEARDLSSSDALLANEVADHRRDWRADRLTRHFDRFIGASPPPI
jgi:hypothetical protein